MRAGPVLARLHITLLSWCAKMKQLANSICLALCVFSQAALADWPLYAGDWNHQRHSPLVEINPQNISKLQLAWEFDTGLESTFQSTPIVIDGVMIVSLPFNHVLALDAATGQQLWKYTHTRQTDRAMCCGPANRGVAVANGLVVMGTVDSFLIALNAKTGQLVWKTDVTGGQQGVAENAALLQGSLAGAGKTTGASGAGINMAPMVYDGKVFVGITGVGYGLHLDSANPDAPLGAVVGIAGEFGRRGFMAAYDLQTGRKVWQFDTVPEKGWEGQFRKTTPDGSPLPRDIEREKAALARYPNAWQFGGGSAWSTPAVDRDLGLIYFGTGNPSPQMEGSSRPGDNLYTSSLVALDLRTGQLRWHYQQVPHDLWGYDVASPPVLFTAQIDGKNIRAVGQAGKTGWFYAHDRETGELLYKSDAFVPQNNMFTVATEQGNVIYPGVVGGANWSPSALDESRRQVVVAGVHWPVRYTLHQLKGVEGKPDVRYSSMSPIEDAERWGLISAIHIDSGKLKWQHRLDEPSVGGVLSTASGLIFSGEGNGRFFALNSADGRRIWEASNPAGVNAPPVSYAVKGRQFVAVAIGGNKLFGFKQGGLIRAWALPPAH